MPQIYHVQKRAFTIDSLLKSTWAKSSSLTELTRSENASPTRDEEIEIIISIFDQQNNDDRIKYPKKRWQITDFKSEIWSASK